MQSWLWARSHLDVYVEKPECSFIPAYSREPKEGVCKRGKEQTELNPIRGKTGGNDASKGWLWVMVSPGTTPRLVQFVHHPFVSGLCPRAQANFAYWWRHFYYSLKKYIYISLNQTAMKWEQKHRREEEIKRDNEKRRRKPINHICTCQCCTQRMATHRLVESNRSLKTERWTN